MSIESVNSRNGTNWIEYYTNDAVKSGAQRHKKHIIYYMQLFRLATTSTLRASNTHCCGERLTVLTILSLNGWTIPLFLAFKTKGNIKFICIYSKDCKYCKLCIYIIVSFMRNFRQLRTVKVWTQLVGCEELLIALRYWW